jgi:hypothetical protein
MQREKQVDESWFGCWNFTPHEGLASTPLFMEKL